MTHHRGKDGPTETLAKTDVVGDPKLAGGGESQGGAYPNPHTGKEKAGRPRHGGQTEIAYHGTGQLGEQDVGGTENANAPATGG